MYEGVKEQYREGGERAFDANFMAHVDVYKRQDPAHTLVLIRRDGSVENYDVDQIQTNDNQTKSGIIDLFVDCLNDPSHEGLSLIHIFG